VVRDQEGWSRKRSGGGSGSGGELLRRSNDAKAS